MPEIPRVCEEFERGSNCFVVTAGRTRAFSHPLPDNDLFIFELADPLFECGEHARLSYVQNPLKQLVHVALDLCKLDRQRLLLIPGVGKKVVPPFAKHTLGHREQLVIGLDRVKQGIEVAFDSVPADRFTVTIAATLRAKIVGMASRSAFRPAGSEWRSAIRAQHITAQREILVEIAPARRSGLSFDLVLDAPERLVGNQTFMLAFAKRDVPFQHFDISRIDGIAEHDRNTLVAHDPAGIFRKQRMVLQEPHHIGLRVEPAGDIAIERFLHD